MLRPAINGKQLLMSRYQQIIAKGNETRICHVCQEKELQSKLYTLWLSSTKGGCIKEGNLLSLELAFWYNSRRDNVNLVGTSTDMNYGHISYLEDKESLLMKRKRKRKKRQLAKSSKKDIRNPSL